MDCEMTHTDTVSTWRGGGRGGGGCGVECKGPAHCNTVCIPLCQGRCHDPPRPGRPVLTPFLFLFVCLFVLFVCFCFCFSFAPGSGLGPAGGL